MERTKQKEKKKKKKRWKEEVIAGKLCGKGSRGCCGCISFVFSLSLPFTSCHEL